MVGNQLVECYPNYCVIDNEFSCLVNHLVNYGVGSGLEGVLYKILLGQCVK